MKKIIRKAYILPGVALIACVISLPALCQRNTSDAIKMAYSYPSDKQVKYMSTSKVVQNMDVNGQTMQTNVRSALGCRIRSLGVDKNNLRLEITVDTLGQTVDTPMGVTGGAVKEVKGKLFNLIISPQGKEVDISGAESVTYLSEDGITNNLSQSFSNFFPDMPENKVKPGFAWTSNDSITEKSPSMTMKMKIKSENKFDGFENIDGRNLAKITSNLSGTRDMKTQSQGMNILIYGPFKGTLELYFDQDAGYFIKQSMTTTMTGTIEVSTPDSMTFPVVMDISSVTEVVK